MQTQKRLWNVKKKNGKIMQEEGKWTGWMFCTWLSFTLANKNRVSVLSVSSDWVLLSINNVPIVSDYMFWIQTLLPHFDTSVRLQEKQQSNNEAKLGEDSVVFCLTVTSLCWSGCKLCGCFLAHKPAALWLSTPVWKLLWWIKQKNELALCFKTHLSTSGWRIVWSKRVWRTCSEEEHCYNAVRLSLRPPAQGNQGHQKRHQSRHRAGPQQHQGGNLPICRTGHRQT